MSLEKTEIVDTFLSEREFIQAIRSQLGKEWERLSLD
jgi:hypothetical protein